MNGSSPHPQMMPPRGGGPDDEPAAIRLGFCAEPIVDLRCLDAAPLYSECLARMLVSESVLLKGGDFVPDFENCGHIGLLDAAVLRLVLDALSDDPGAVLGCNISPKTLADARAWAGIIRPIARRPWLAKRLVLEVTESAPLDGIAGAAERLAQAKQAGCRLAIDDFGAGFATLAHLRAVGVAWDIVKIDRSCLAGSTSDLSARLADLVRLARGLTEHVVVEGIETEDQLAAAHAAGADYGQGWLFVRPVVERWEAIRPGVGQRLATTLIDHGALMRRAPAVVLAGNAAVGDGPQRGDRSYLLSRVDQLGDRVRALIRHARAGGTS